MDLLNNAVVIPNPPDWRLGVRAHRRWQTEIAKGVTSAEDRATGRTTAFRRIQYVILAENVGDRALLQARLQAALKSGQAVCPLWSAAAKITGAIQARSCQVAGGWPFRPGDYAFFVRSPMPVNRILRINCGGSASGDWLADTGFTGGSTISTASAIQIGLLTEAPPAAVLQSARKGTTSSAGTEVIRYTLTGFQTSAPVRLRVYFAEIEAAFERRLFDVHVIGDTTTIATVDPYAAGANYKLVASQIEVTVWPTLAGTIAISFRPKAHTIPASVYSAIVNGIEAFQYGWEYRQLNSRTRFGTIEWDTPLRGVYDGTAVHPAIFGTPETDEVEVITGRVGEFKLSITEPLGTGTVATPGTCPAEVCTPDVYRRWFPNGGTPDIPGSPGADVLTSGYGWSLNQYENPNKRLLSSQIACHLAIHAIEVAGISPAPSLIGETYWRWMSAPASTKLALAKWTAGVCDPNDPTGDLPQSYFSNGYATLETVYSP